MNLGQIIDRVYSPLRDSPGGTVTEQDILGWVNESCLDLAARLRLLPHSWTGVISANPIAFPSTLIEARGIRVAGINHIPVDDEVWWSWSDAASVPDEPYFFRVLATGFELYPAPTVGAAYEIRGWRQPLEMDSPDDVPEVPAEVHIRLVNYARAHGKYKLGETRDGDTYMALYLDNLPNAPTSRGRVEPGPWSLRPEFGPFDNDPDAVHI
jgi:hypothetical protein